MQIEIKIDPAYQEPKVIVWTASMTEEVEQMVGQLKGESVQILTGSREGWVEVLPPDQIIRIYATGGKIYAVTEQGEYLLRLRLYELEKRLDPQRFIRISHSEIVNLDHVKGFDLNLVGTICVRLEGENVTYVSRRYMSKIKQILGV